MKSSNNYFNQLFRLSSEIRRSTRKRLEEVPEGFINWRLNNTAMSFAHLAQHIIKVDRMFIDLATTNNKKYRWILGSEESHKTVGLETYGAMLEELKDFGAKRDSIIAAFDNTSINKLVSDENGDAITLGWFLIHKVLEHEIYHRGQIAAYLKVLKGESIKI